MGSNCSCCKNCPNFIAQESQNEDIFYTDIYDPIKEEKKIVLKNEIAKRAINSNYVIDDDIASKTKNYIFNEYNNPDSVLKTTQQIESDIATLGTILKEEIIKEKKN